MYSRRDFLRLSGGALAAVAALAALPASVRANIVDPTDAESGLARDISAPPAPLGRVTMFGADVHAKPERTAELIRRAKRDEVISLLRQVKGDPVFRHNDVWYEVSEGFVYSPLIQPVQNVRNTPVLEAARTGFWGEITVPVSVARWGASQSAKQSTMLYFGSVFRVIDAAQDEEGVVWYRLQQGVAHTPGPWIPAEDLRRFDPVKDLAPLSPEIEDKRIEINIAAQTMTAFENGLPVFSTRVSTGKGTNFTPRGNYRVWRKAIGQRMIGGVGSDFYDLPGVPFPVYFTYRGIAFHGAYWHNDFGVVRSHGCINILPEQARWVWRWTTPQMAYNDSDVRFGWTGTPVRVI